MSIYDNPEKTELLKNEIKLLKELNEALTDKNKLLEDQLEKEKSTTKTAQRTYANATSSIVSKPKVILRIVIKRKNTNDKSDMKGSVLHYLTKEKNIQTKRISMNRNEEITINCMNIESYNYAEKILETKLSKSYIVEKEQLKNPVIKIIGVNNIFNLKNSEIEDDINRRNFANFQTKGKVLSTFESRQKTTIIIMEVTRKIHKHIKENKDRIFFGYQNCKVFDVINVKPCFNCGRFAHNENKCRNKKVCLRCAGNHQTRYCLDSNTICCTNCKYSNETYGTKYNCNHVATDSELCEILKTKIRKFLNTTDYSIKPYIPRLLGKVDNYNRNQHKAKKTMTFTNAIHGGSTSALSANLRSERATSITQHGF